MHAFDISGANYTSLIVSGTFFSTSSSLFTLGLSE
jgi:hypothetical protein